MNNQSSSLEFSHFPVMLNEVIKLSSISVGGRFIDCTFGGGGYSKEILKFPNTYVHAIDRDKNVLFIAKKLETKFPSRFKFHQSKFSKLDTITNDYVDAIIFDLGLSSIQLNDLERGFSFKSNKKLNMTMGLNEISALDVINKTKSFVFVDHIKLVFNYRLTDFLFSLVVISFITWQLNPYIKKR